MNQYRDSSNDINQCMTVHIRNDDHDYHGYSQPAHRISIWFSSRPSQLCFHPHFALICATLKTSIQPVSLPLLRQNWKGDGWITLTCRHGVPFPPFFALWQLSRRAMYLRRFPTFGAVMLPYSSWLIASVSLLILDVYDKRSATFIGISSIWVE